MSLVYLKVTKKYSSNLNNQYIEYLNLGICLNKKSINILKKYFDDIYSVSETLFKSIIILNKKNPNIEILSETARLKFNIDNILSANNNAICTPMGRPESASPKILSPIPICNCKSPIRGNIIPKVKEYKKKKRKTNRREEVLFI